MCCQACVGFESGKTSFHVSGKVVFSSVQDENGDGAISYNHHKARERDSLEDLRVRRRKSAVLFYGNGSCLHRELHAS
jgi:hypothetical protein